MYHRINHLFIISLFIIVLTLSLSYSNVSAELTVQIMTHPNVQSIILGSGPGKIGIAAHTNTPNVKYAWSLDGPGELDGDPTTPGMIYIPPDVLHGETSAEAIVTVVITDVHGEKATDRVTFTLSNPTTPPPPTPSPPVDPLAECDDCFQRRRYTTPEENNAFDCYRNILEKDPSNSHAKKKIYEIARIYKDWGDTAYEQRDCAKARTYYERYRFVARYIMNTFGDPTVKQTSQEVLARSETCLQPTPTPWTPNCTSEIRGLEEIQQACLSALETYKVLKSEEQEGQNRNNEIISTLNNVICDLIEVENILNKSYKETSDEAILQRLQRTQKTREMFTQEILERIEAQ